MTRALARVRETLSRRERGVAERPIDKSAVADLRRGEGYRTYPRSQPLTPLLRSYRLPMGEGGGTRPSPRGRGWSRSDRVRGPQTPQDRNPSPRCSAATLSLWERIETRCSVDAWIRIARHPCSRDISRAQDFPHDPVQPRLHLVVGEPQFEIAVPLDRVASFAVGDRPQRMMWAVDLDREAEGKAGEIGDESCNRNLTAEFQAREPRTAQNVPQRVFRRGGCAAQFSRDGRQAVGHEVEDRVLRRRLQPLTRSLRDHPLPMGEGR